MAFPGGSVVKESACSAGAEGLIPGLERSPGGGYGNPLQLFLPKESCGQWNLEAAVHRVAQNRAQLKRLSTDTLEEQVRSGLPVW